MKTKKITISIITLCIFTILLLPFKVKAITILEEINKTELLYKKAKALNIKGNNVKGILTDDGTYVYGTLKVTYNKLNPTGNY